MVTHSHTSINSKRPGGLSYQWDILTWDPGSRSLLSWQHSSGLPPPFAPRAAPASFLCLVWHIWTPGKSTSSDIIYHCDINVFTLCTTPRPQPPSSWPTTAKTTMAICIPAEAWQQLHPPASHRDMPTTVTTSICTNDNHDDAYLQPRGTTVQTATACSTQRYAHHDTHQGQ